MPYVKQIFYERVGALADIVELSSNSYDELEQDFKTKYLGVKAIYHLRDPGSYFGHLGEEFFQRVPGSCTVCSHREWVSPVTHTPSAVDDATATTTVYLIISAMRQFAKAEVACRAGQWKKNLPLARDPEYKTLGIVGMGGIGTVVARRMALGWGMRVVYHNRSKLKQEPGDFAVEYKDSLEDLLKEADVVSLHIPTENLLGKAQFDAMKQGSVLVNTARTWDSRDKMALMVLDNILAALKDEPLPNVIPEHQ
ncbi:hypothetical protein IAU60_003176 [Kwoniella sp. DSM 27419]